VIAEAQLGRIVAVLSFLLIPACASPARPAATAHLAEGLPSPAASSGGTSPPSDPVAPPAPLPPAPAPPVAAPPTASTASSAPVATPDPSPARHHAGPREPVEEAAMRLTAAWAACDLPTAVALSLAYEEVLAITSKPTDRTEWNKSTLDFADERCREFAQAKGRVIAAKLVRTEHHDRTETPELKVDLDIVFVQLVIEQNGVANVRGAPLPFIRVGDAFKFVSKP
jgi:hypothetical protein